MMTDFHYTISKLDIPNNLLGICYYANNLHSLHDHIGTTFFLKYTIKFI